MKLSEILQLEHGRFEVQCVHSDLYLVTLTIVHDMGNFSNEENKDIVTIENNWEVGVNIDTTAFKSSILLRDRVETLRKPSKV